MVFPKKCTFLQEIPKQFRHGKKYQHSLLLQADIHTKSDLICENVYLFASILPVPPSCTISKIVYIFNTLFGEIYGNNLFAKRNLFLPGAGWTKPGGNPGDSPEHRSCIPITSCFRARWPGGSLVFTPLTASGGRWFVKAALSGDVCPAAAEALYSPRKNWFPCGES